MYHRRNRISAVRPQPDRRIHSPAAFDRRAVLMGLTALIGMGLATWRQQVRLMAALSLLSSGKSVTSVAYDVGYESPSSFTAMFHRVWGVPPSAYLAS